MRTVLVNPSYMANPTRAYAGLARRPRRRARVAQNIAIVPMANPRRRLRRRSHRRRRNPYMLANPRRHRRRQNMLILPNARSYRRRRNPTMSLPSIVKNVAISLGGAGVGFGLNAFLIGKLGNDTQLPPGSAPTGQGMALRGAVRILVSIAGAMLFPGSFATALGGAVCYPIYKEFWDYWQATHPAAGAVTGVTPTTTLQDLSDVLDGY